MLHLGLFFIPTESSMNWERLKAKNGELLDLRVKK